MGYDWQPRPDDLHGKRLMVRRDQAERRPVDLSVAAIVRNVRLACLSLRPVCNTMSLAGSSGSPRRGPKINGAVWRYVASQGCNGQTCGNSHPDRINAATHKHFDPRDACRIKGPGRHRANTAWLRLGCNA